MVKKLINILLLCSCVVVAIAQNVEPRPPITNEIASIENFDRAEPALTTRLPNDTIPHDYDVYLHTSIHEANFSFNGHVTILIETLIATSRITLHAFHLAFDEINVLFMNGTTEQNLFAGYSLDNVNEFLIIDLLSELPANVTCSLYIVFRGTLRTDDAGFYRSSYINPEGERIWLATTQFESVDARSAFPCYDEPRLRATFTIAIMHHNTRHAISNMPVKSISVINDYVVTNFEKSVSMPTYLVAFVVSDFHYSYNITNGFEHRIYAQPDRVSETQFALESGVLTIDAFAQYFGINYTLPKMDQIAIPDFAAGAMENWGLITYRTVYLLFTQGVSTSRDKENVASVISHELAHQWFGNLVTPEWWTYLWLNEGFATFYEYYATHWVYPQMRMDELFVVETLQGVFWSDSFDTTRPMTYYVEKRNDIDRIFDGVAYSKSGSVLRMMNYALSEPTFKKGIYYYLTENALGLGTPDRLFAGLQRAADEDDVLPEGVTVFDIMRTWTLQKGYPIINVWRDFNSSSMQIHQTRFQMNSFFDPLQLRWWIPFNIATSRYRNFNNTTPMDWLPNNFTTIYTPPSELIFDQNDWILFNTKQAGYYRVNYDSNNWDLLARELLNGNFEDIIPINRAQLIDDSLMIARANQLSYFSAMNILNYLQNEVDLIPWISANSNLPYLTRLMTGVEFYEYFANLMVRLSARAYMKYGARELYSDTHDYKAARTIVMNWACRFGMGVCLYETRERLTDHLFGANATNITVSLEPNLRTHIYCHGLRRSEVRHYRKVWEMLTTSTDTTQRNYLINGLGCMEDSAKIELVLMNSLNETLFSAADMRRFITAIVGNTEQGIYTYMNFLVNNYVALREPYSRLNLVSNMMSAIAPRITTTELLLQFTRVTRYFGTYISDSSFNSAMTQVEDNFRWLERNEGPIRAFMSSHGYLDDGMVSSSTVASISIMTTIIAVCIAIFNF